MPVPSKADISKRQKNIEQLSKKLEEKGKLKEQELIRLFRKGVDSAWMVSPNKLVFFESRIEPDMRPDTRTKWLIKCDKCLQMFVTTKVEVDHKVGEFPCKSREDFASYAISRLDVVFEDLQILCKDDKSKGHTGCHSIKTYAERHNMTFEEAELEKRVIKVCKNNASYVFQWLKQRGVEPESNSTKRREQVKEYLKQEAKKE